MNNSLNAYNFIKVQIIYIKCMPDLKFLQTTV